MEATIDETKLKQLVKEALIDLLDERREFLSELLIEAMEDTAMIRAIQEGEQSPLVDKEEILRQLDDEA